MINLLGGEGGSGGFVWTPRCLLDGFETHPQLTQGIGVVGANTQHVGESGERVARLHDGRGELGRNLGKFLAQRSHVVAREGAHGEVQRLADG